jgi:hypothetical protein
MRIAIGPLARSGINAQFGGDTEAGLRAALFHYAAKLRSGRGSVEYPSFLQDEGFSGSEASTEVEIDGDVEKAIEVEAERQGRTTAELAGHAVLVYLAELEAVGATPAATNQRKPV